MKKDKLHGTTFSFITSLWWVCVCQSWFLSLADKSPVSTLMLPRVSWSLPMFEFELNLLEAVISKPSAFLEKSSWSGSNTTLLGSRAEKASANPIASRTLGNYQIVQFEQNRLKHSSFECGYNIVHFTSHFVRNIFFWWLQKNLRTIFDYQVVHATRNSIPVCPIYFIWVLNVFVNISFCKITGGLVKLTKKPFILPPLSESRKPYYFQKFKSIQKSKLFEQQLERKTKLQRKSQIRVWRNFERVIDVEPPQ